MKRIVILIDARCTVSGAPNTPYAPSNLPKNMRPDQIAEITPQEQTPLPGANVQGQLQGAASDRAPAAR